MEKYFKKSLQELENFEKLSPVPALPILSRLHAFFLREAMTSLRQRELARFWLYADLCAVVYRHFTQPGRVKGQNNQERKASENQRN